MALLINNESPQNIIYNGNEVLKVIYNDVVVWEKQNEQQVYKRRIMVGDNLRNLNIFLEQYPDDFYNDLWDSDGEGTTVVIECNNDDFGQTIHTYVQAEYIPSEDVLNPLNGYIGIDIAYDYTIYDFDLTTTPIEVNVNSPIQIYNDSDYIVTNIKDTSANYKCLFIEDPNIRPIQVGDKIVAGTKFYGVVPDDYNANNINSIIYDANNNSVGYFSFYENTAELWIRASSSASFDYMFQKNPYFSVNNSQIISQTEYTVGSITNQSNPNFTYLLVDTTTLGNNEESVSIDTVTHYEGVADGLSLIISPCNTANYSNQSVLTAVENFNSSENYSLENVLNDLQVNIEQEIVTLQGTLIDVLNYEIIRNFEINITDGLDTYLDSANDGTILDYNGYFSMILGDLIDGIVEDYLLMIVNPNTMDVYFYEFNQESFNPLTGECVIEFNQFPNRDFLGPYFLLKKKE